MARSRRQQRKQRQQEASPKEDAAVEPDPSDAEESGPDPAEVVEDVLIAALGPLRRARNHPLLPGIRMFTAMLEEARGGYAADRLEQMEHALAIDFNPLEREGILQISMAEMDEAGIPDVERGVELALRARADLGPDFDDKYVEGGEVDTEDLNLEDAEPINGYQSQTEEARRLAASGAPEVDVEEMDAQVLERQAEENAATVEDGEPEDPDAPGPDEDD